MRQDSPEKQRRAGDIGGMMNLAEMLEKGICGLQKDPLEAISWYQKAADLASRSAQLRLDPTNRTKTWFMEVPRELRSRMITAYRTAFNKVVAAPGFCRLTRDQKLARIASVDRELSRGVARGNLEETWAGVLEQEIAKMTKEFREQIITTTPT